MTIRALFRVFYKIEIKGGENLEKGPAILACNHVSFLDPPLVGCFSGFDVHFLARQSLFKHFIFGKVISFLHAHPISGTAHDIELFERVDEILSGGGKVVMFPEGKRSRDGTLLPFKRGVGFIIEKSYPLVYPIYISGAYEAWNRSQRMPKLFKKITITYGSPLRFLPSDTKEGKEFQLEIAKTIEDAVRKLS